MADSALAAHDKRRVALGVAMSIRGRYMIEYDAAILRRAGDDDRDLLEILGVSTTTRPSTPFLNGCRSSRTSARPVL